MKFIAYYEDANNFYFVSELYTGKNLLQYLNGHYDHLTEAEIAEMIRQVLLAINHCHINNVIHRDVKLENFMYYEPQSKTIKMIDFGYSTAWKGFKIESLVIGSQSFIAPEIARAEPYDAKCDVWSLGMIYNVLINASYAYDMVAYAQLPKLIEQIKFRKFSIDNDFNYGFWRLTSNKQKKFALKMLQNNPDKRAVASELFDDKWFSSMIKHDISEKITNRVITNIRKTTVSSLKIINK